jgi:DUF4097 and DUF4098 domain-containing protein YvlB
MSEETLMILRMIQEGKITPEQGEGLLRAVEGDEQRVRPTWPPPPSPPHAPETLANGHGSSEVISEMQARLGELQTKLGEVQARLGAAQASSSSSERPGFSWGAGAGFPFGIGDLNISRVFDEAVRGASSLKTEAVRMAKQAAREAQKEGRRIRHEARRAGRQFRVEVNFDFDESERPTNSAGLPEHTEKTISDVDLGKDQGLRVINPYGNVRIVGASDDGKAHIESTRTAWADSDSERDNELNGLKVAVSEEGGSVQVSGEAEGDMPDGTLDLAITVPPATPVEIETTFGDIHCEELTAGVPKIESLSGNITLLHMQNESETASTTIRTKSGDVSIRQWRGGETKVETASGNLQMDGLRAPKASLLTRSGSVNLLNVDIGVDLNMDTASGNLNLQGGQCGQALFLKSQSGDVEFQKIRAGRLHIETVSGDQNVDQATATNGPITLKSVSGDIQAKDVQATEATMNMVSGDGSLAFAAPFEGTLAAASVSGDLQVRLWSNSNAKLEMSTQSGDLNCELPLEERHGDGVKHLSGRIGEGAGSIKLQSVSGALLVRSVQ